MRHPSTDYHDYVFQDNKLVGRFEEMYQFSQEIPWHQDQLAASMISDMDMTILKQFKYSNICDVGCGLGYFTYRLFAELVFTKERKQVTGIDISTTAVTQATQRFGQIRFLAADLLKERPLPREQFDLVVVKELFWYVCHRYERFGQTLLEMLTPGGFLYVSQSFPEKEAWIGQEIASGPEQLKGILSHLVAPVEWCINWHVAGYKNGHLHFLGQKKKI